MLKKVYHLLAILTILIIYPNINKTFIRTSEFVNNNQYIFQFNNITKSINQYNNLNLQNSNYLDLNSTINYKYIDISPIGQISINKTLIYATYIAILNRESTNNIYIILGGTILKRLSTINSSLNDTFTTKLANPILCKFSPNFSNITNPIFSLAILSPSYVSTFFVTSQGQLLNENTISLKIANPITISFSPYYSGNSLCGIIYNNNNSYNLEIYSLSIDTTNNNSNLTLQKQIIIENNNYPVDLSFNDIILIQFGIPYAILSILTLDNSGNNYIQQYKINLTNNQISLLNTYKTPLNSLSKIKYSKGNSAKYLALLGDGVNNNSNIITYSSQLDGTLKFINTNTFNFIIEDIEYTYFFNSNTYLPYISNYNNFNMLIQNSSGLSNIPPSTRGINTTFIINTSNKNSVNLITGGISSYKAVIR